MDLCLNMYFKIGKELADLDEYPDTAKGEGAWQPEESSIGVRVC